MRVLSVILMVAGGLLVFYGGVRLFAMTVVPLDDPGSMLWTMLIGLAVMVGGWLLNRSSSKPTPNS